MLDEFVKAGLMAELSERQGCFALLRAPSLLHAGDVVDIVMAAGSSPTALGLDDLDPHVTGLLKRFNDDIGSVLKCTSVQELLEEDAARTDL